MVFCVWSCSPRLFFWVGMMGCLDVSEDFGLRSGTIDSAGEIHWFERGMHLRRVLLSHFVPLLISLS